MGSPKKIASPYSGLLGIFASLCCVQGPFVAQKSALTDGQQASSDMRATPASSSFDFTHSTFERRIWTRI